MDLRSQNPYWLLRHGILHTYPSLAENISADIAIIGGGISGALTAYYLQQAGFSIVLVDRRHIGMGSTVASTALLQYEIDVPLYKLSNMVGELNAVRSYHLCLKAIDDIGAICKKLGVKDIFQPKPSFQFASFKKHRKGLEQEYELRKKNGIELQWLEQKDIEEKYGFSRSCGILSKAGAELDAYYLTHQLMAYCIRRGAKVYDHTEVADIQHRKRSVELVTKDGVKIKAGKLVIACGFESQQYVPFSVQKLHSTYAIISEPFSERDFWYRNSLIWETHNPYIYMRTTNDHRIIIGGKDMPFSDPLRRDRLLTSKTKALEASFSTLFPGIRFKTDFKWAGSFAITKDGLPFIGSIRQRPHTYFALGFGGNGTTFSVVAAQIIRDELMGKKNDAAAIFTFNR
jgi:glycine/D-amino acid oxidase-like deaminating enzyme